MFRTRLHFSTCLQEDGCTYSDGTVQNGTVCFMCCNYNKRLL